MLSLFWAPTASGYITALGQQSLFNLYNPVADAFAHHPLGLAPLLDHASLLNRASLLNHPSPLLRTSRFDFSHALQQHRLDPILEHVLERLGANIRAKMAHDTDAQAKKHAAIRHAKRQIHKGLLRWHEAGGDSGLEATLRLPGFEMSELKAVLSDPHHLTITMTVRGEEGHLEQTMALPFAVRDPAAVELVHDVKGGIVTVRLAKPADEASPEPIALPIVALATAELDKTKAAAGADPKVEAATQYGLAAATLCAKVAPLCIERLQPYAWVRSEQVAQDKSDEEQLDERFADVVAARAAANGAAAEAAAEAEAEAAAEVAAEAEVAAAAEAAAPAEAEAEAAAKEAAAAAAPPPPPTVE